MTVKREKAIMVACGGHHTLFLSHHNDIFSVGSNSHGQLGLNQGDFDS